MGLDAAGVLLDDPSRVRDGASSLLDAVSRFTVHAEDVRSGWLALGGLYQAPEQGLVLAAMDRPQQAADDLFGQVLTAHGALGAYADRLTELHARRDQLAADIGQFHADVARDDEGFTLDDLNFDFWRLGREEELASRIATLLSDRDAAANECANVISAIFSDVRYSRAGETSVGDPYQFGATAESYEQLTASGDAAWGVPDSWTTSNVVVGLYQSGRAVTWGTLTTLGTLVGNASGLNGEGARDATWSGLWQLTQDVAKWSSTPLLLSGFATDPEGMVESGERLKQVGGAMIGWGQWDGSPWATGGQVVSDVALTIFGGAGVAKAGATATARGLSLVSRAGLVGRYGSKVGDLASALRVAANSQFSLKVEALTYAERLAYRAHDTVTAVTATTKAHLGDAWTKAVTHVESTLPRPALALAGDGGDLRRVLDAPPAGRVHHDLDATGRSPGTPGSALPRVPEEQLARWTPESGSPHPLTDKRYAYAGNPQQGTLGAPPAVRTVVDIDHRSADWPRWGRAFGMDKYGHEVTLAAETAYRVPGRGTYFTNEAGKIVFGDLTHASPRMLGDLRRALPNVTYHVDDYTYLRTDDYGRQVHQHIEDVVDTPDNRYSRAAHRNVRGTIDGRLYDPGHANARATGGLREELNLSMQLKEVNRDGSRFSVRPWERDVLSRVRAADAQHAVNQAAGNATPREKISVDIYTKYDDVPADPGKPWSTPPYEYVLEAKSSTDDTFRKIARRSNDPQQVDAW